MQTILLLSFTLCFIPQVLLMIKNKSSYNISIYFITGLFISVFFTNIYLIFYTTLFLIKINYFLLLIISAIMLYLKLIYYKS